MTRDEFWQLIDSTRPKGVWAAMHSGFVELKLETLPEEEIISFDRHFWEVMAESCRWDLWGAAYIVNGGCSDDGFVYFRAWLISQGKRYYEKCLRDPEAVGARAERDDRTEDEEFMHCAAEAYREKTGRELPPAEVPGVPEPAGQRWDEADLPKLYPKLAKKFGLIPPD
jgi:hypothetical protein